MMYRIHTDPGNADRDDDRDESNAEHGATVRPTVLYRRSRLISWLSAASTAQLICLQAPAGFGKTTTLDQWAEVERAAGKHIVRVSCSGAETGIDDAVAALEHGLVSRGLESSQARPASRESLIREIEALDRFIDVLVDEGSSRLSPESLGLFFELALRTSRTRVFIASRRKLTSGLAHGRMQGRVAVIDADRLAFDCAEARAVFAAHGVTINGADVDALMRATAGWPVGLHLLAANAADGPSAARAATALINRSEVCDLLAEEVLARASDDVGFLVSVSILDRLHPALCDAVTNRSDSRETLQRLCDEGLFVLRFDDEDSYRLHPVLRALLLARMGSERLEDRNVRHLRASRWLEQHGLFIEAVDHAMQAGEQSEAARILDAHCDDFYLHGLEQSILPTTALLPPAVRRRFPRILLAMSWRMLAEWRFDQARALVDCAGSRLAEMRREGALSSEEQHVLEYQIRHRRVMQSLFREDFGRVVADGGPLLDEQQGNPYERMSLYAAILYARRELLQLAQLDRLEGLGRELLPNVPGRYVHVLFESMVAPGRLLRGETDSAIALLEHALRTSTDVTGPGSALGASVALILSEARYACNDIGAAEKLVHEYLPVAGEAGFVDQLISGYVTQARLQRRQGDVDKALATLKDAEAIAGRRGFHRLGVFALAERIALLSRVGQRDEAARVARWQGLKLSAPPRIAKEGATREDNAMALAWVRLAHASGADDAALAVSKTWRTYVASTKALVNVVEWDLLRAEILLATHQKSIALRVLAQAVATAAPARLIRPFVDEAAALGTLLDSLVHAHLLGAQQLRFLEGIVAVIADEAGSSPTALAEDLTDARDAISVATPLTARELGILKLVAAGHVNAEIGKRLGLTHGTVKWYLHQVYGKLGCKRRITAIEQGRRLGLID